MENNDFFDPSKRTDVNRLVSAAIEAGLSQGHSQDFGILRTGRTRHKRATLCTFGVIFRDTQNRTEEAGHMKLGSRQVMTEILPSLTKPAKVSARVIVGKDVPDKVLHCATTAFMSVRHCGGFDFNFEEGVRRYAQTFVEKVREHMH